jgi:hypothetical protein
MAKETKLGRLIGWFKKNDGKISKPNTSGNTLDQFEKACDVIIDAETNPFLKLEARDLKAKLQKAKTLEQIPKVIEVVGNVDCLMDLATELKQMGLDCVCCDETEWMGIDCVEDKEYGIGWKAHLSQLRKGRKKLFEP